MHFIKRFSPKKKETLFSETYSRKERDRITSLCECTTFFLAKTRNGLIALNKNGKN
jgi:hypothetical protein